MKTREPVKKVGSCMTCSRPAKVVNVFRGMGAEVRLCDSCLAGKPQEETSRESPSGIDRSAVLCAVCGVTVGDGGVVYLNGSGQIEGLCEGNHDSLLGWIRHTPIIVT